MASAASSHLVHLPFTKPASFPSTRPPPSLRTFPSPSAAPSFRPLPLPGGPLRWPPSPLDASIDPVEVAVNPALRNANVLFCCSGYNVQIMVGEDEPEEVLLRRFRREVSKAGVIQECKRRRFFENKQEEKKRKAREAGRRNRRRRSGPRFTSSSSTAAASDAAPKNSRDDGDNWDMPE